MYRLSLVDRPGVVAIAQCTLRRAFRHPITPAAALVDAHRSMMSRNPRRDAIVA